AEAEASYASEKDYLEDSRSLLAEDLISEQEIRQQEAKVKQCDTKLKHLNTQMEMTKKYLNPLSMDAAQAKLASAEQALAIARQEVTDCTVRAPADGMVIYMPTHISGEYRTVRVGDSVYKNQPFMAIPDMSNLVVHCYVPESDMSRVAAGHRVVITPVAYPDLVMTGAVESVGSMAQTLMEKPNWQKYFHVITDLKSADERMRSGMSVSVRILSYENADTVLIPRTAVQWDGETARCRVVKGRATEERKIDTGKADDRFVEVLNGLQPGERVLTE
ncbi:MAG: efflux RND transporter periplasmic adaptor subunit, partial [Lentisphaerota bacterium]